MGWVPNVTGSAPQYRTNSVFCLCHLQLCHAHFDVLPIEVRAYRENEACVRSKKKRIKQKLTHTLTSLCSFFEAKAKSNLHLHWSNRSSQAIKPNIEVRFSFHFAILISVFDVSRIKLFSFSNNLPFDW